MNFFVFFCKRADGLQAERITYRLTQQGDRFKPFGMKGTKLVSDYLTDRKRNYM